MRTYPSHVEGGYRIRFPRSSPECRALEARYPGIRFNRVLVEDDSNIDYFDVSFNLSGTAEALDQHGFAHPKRCMHRFRTREGWRLTYASYEDGLERIAALFIPQLLARVSKERQL